MCIEEFTEVLPQLPRDKIARLPTMVSSNTGLVVVYMVRITGGGTIAETEAESAVRDAGDVGRSGNFVLTGIDGLDEMLGRGVPTGHIITVLGSFGTGKTTFALQFLMQGLINGEKAIFISLEEDADSVIANAASFGWDLATCIFTAEVKDDNPRSSRDGLVEYVSDGVIGLRFNERENGEVQLVMQVIKMRRLKHPRSVKPYSITEQGLEVHGDMEVF